MQKAMGNMMFRLMSLEFKLKALLHDPSALLAEAGVGEGMTLIDFGCGPGRYTIPAARLVGSGGRVYAVDLHPLAIAEIERTARRKSLTNVTTCATDSRLPLPEASADFVLLYDTLHDVEQRAQVVRELLRVLKAGGILSYRDHTLDAETAFAVAIRGGYLRPLEGGGQTARLLRSASPPPAATPSAGAP